VRLITVIRHAAAIAALPFTVTVLIPAWIGRSNQTSLHAPADWPEMVGVLAGIALTSVGLALFVATLRLFGTVGQGTLAPWDPPKQLVVRGPYRYVRNPMISGVLFVLFGEALILRSPPHLQWAVLFLLINAVYIPLIEEPQLAARFGDAYRDYRRHVGRLIPRIRPWTQESS
jgi:protein-S-isoprenylcysteine O-methyltransferase Ste14